MNHRRHPRPAPQRASVRYILTNRVTGQQHHRRELASVIAKMRQRRKEYVTSTLSSSVPWSAQERELMAHVSMHEMQQWSLSVRGAPMPSPKECQDAWRPRPRTKQERPQPRPPYTAARAVKPICHMHQEHDFVHRYSDGGPRFAFLSCWSFSAIGHWRYPKTQNERRQRAAHHDDLSDDLQDMPHPWSNRIRRRRRHHLPTAWDDIQVALHHASASWKHTTRRRHQWVSS